MQHAQADGVSALPSQFFVLQLDTSAEQRTNRTGTLRVALRDTGQGGGWGKMALTKQVYLGLGVSGGSAVSGVDDARQGGRRAVGMRGTDDWSGMCAESKLDVLFSKEAARFMTDPEVCSKGTRPLSQEYTR